MRDRQDRNAIRQFNEDDVIRKVMHWHPANVPVVNAWHWRAGGRKAFD
jgi:hypothetical protein